MREFNKDTIDTVPEEIMLTDPEVIQLMGMEPDVGIKMAFAAGAQAMEQLDAKEQAESEDVFSDFFQNIVLRIMQNRDLLDGVHISAFDSSKYTGSIVNTALSQEQYLRQATAWAEQNYKLIESTLSLVAESLDKMADELEEFT